MFFLHNKKICLVLLYRMPNINNDINTKAVATIATTATTVATATATAATAATAATTTVAVAAATIATKNNAGRKKDPVRLLYVKDVKSNKLDCTYENCNKTFAITTSVISLKAHISEKHNSNANAQNVIITNQSEQYKNELVTYKTFAIAFAKNSLPHSLIENKHFSQAIQTLDNKCKLSKRKLKEFIISEGENANREMLASLGSNNKIITVAIDGWTNVRSNKVTNILLISLGESFFYKSIENPYEQNTAEYLIPILKENIQFLIDKKIRVVALTTDNENLMINVRNKMKNIFPVLIIIPCSAHIIQLCFKTLCKINNIKLIIDETMTIIYDIKNNIKNRLLLLNLQKNDNQPEQLKLIYPIDIRWTSLINGIERLHALKKYVEQVNKCISKNYWEQLNYLYEILIPFKKAINNIQRNDSTIYSVWNNFNDIVNYYNSSNVPKIFQNDIKNITNVIINKWNQHVNKELIEISRIFNLELHVKYSNKTIDFIKDWGSDYLIFYNLINNVNKKDLMETINIQLNEFNLRYGDFSTINEQNEKLKCTYAIRQKRYDIKLLWNLCIISYYELSNIAIAILSICPSEAQVERSFSIQADVHSLDRNKLHAELVEAEMNIKMNIPD